MISVEDQVVYFGPNPFCRDPVIAALLRLGPPVQSSASGLCQRIRLLYPEWFPEPQDLAASPVVQIAQTALDWARSVLNEKTGYVQAGGVEAFGDGARLWLGFHVQELSWKALEIGLNAIANAGRPEPAVRESAQEALAPLWSDCGKVHPDIQIRVLMQAAACRDIPVLPFAAGFSRFWQFGWGARSQVFFQSASNQDGFVGGIIVNSKSMAKEVLSALGAPTPRYVLVNQPDELAAAAQTIGWPCVTKPLNRGGGKGITVGLTDLEQLKAGFDHARLYSQGQIMVEAFVPGNDYRLMVANGKFMAAICRKPSSVTGDGQRSIRDLIAEINRTRSQNPRKSRLLRPIRMDDVLDRHLAAQGFTLDAVLPQGRTITLRNFSNRSSGGIVVDETNRVHPQLKRFTEMLAEAVGLSNTGFDYITPDISRHWTEVGGAFIELNTTPGVNSLLAAGLSAEYVGGEVLGPVPGRIPLALAIVPSADIPAMQPWLVQQKWPAGFGWACDALAGIGNVSIGATERHVWPAARAVLRHRSVKKALIVSSSEDVMRYGAPVDGAAQIWTCGAHLDAGWLAALRRLSVGVTQVNSRSDIYAKCLNWTDATTS